MESNDGDIVNNNAGGKKRKSLTDFVLRAIGVLSGVQVIGILCSVVRSKLVSVWIGAAGLGIFGLYNSAIEMIASFAHLGIRNSAVKDIASADDDSLPFIVKALRRWAGALGMVSAVLTMLFAPLLSRLTFGDDTHVWGFVFLSFALLLTSITNGELAILQGRQALKRFAKASVWGAAIGLVVSVPLFYYMRERSIVPSILVYALATFVAVMFLREREVDTKVKMSARATITQGKSFVMLGIFMTVSGFEQMLSNYVLLAYLNNVADTAMVGFYNSGYTLFNRYVGLVFSAIAVEYYPRLSKSISDTARTSLYVSHETSVSLWLLLPFIAIFIAASPLIVRLLYTSEFDVIVPFVVIAIVGTVFRAVSWCMAFVIIAKGDGVVYIVTETLSTVIGLALNIVGYRMAGLIGLGAAYVVWYVIYTVIIGVVCRFRYKLSLSNDAVLSALWVTVGCVVTIVAFFAAGWVGASVVALPACVAAFWKISRLRLRI